MSNIFKDSENRKRRNLQNIRYQDLRFNDSNTINKKEEACIFPYPGFLKTKETGIFSRDITIENKLLGLGHTLDKTKLVRPLPEFKNNMKVCDKYYKPQHRERELLRENEGFFFSKDILPENADKRFLKFNYNNSRQVVKDIKQNLMKKNK